MAFWTIEYESTVQKSIKISTPKPESVFINFCMNAFFHFLIPGKLAAPCKVRSLEITGGIALATIASYVICRIIG
ncbi:hypothetical protein J2X72_004840 [Phyllobacterium sp. 1468]|nr:hypothetical protein [Phyllobacterium sp. 1468]